MTQRLRVIGLFAAYFSLSTVLGVVAGWLLLITGFAGVIEPRALSLAEALALGLRTEGVLPFGLPLLASCLIVGLGFGWLLGRLDGAPKQE